MNSDFIPPHDLTTERCVLLACFSDEQVAQRAFEWSTQEDFYSPRFGLIFSTLKRLGTGDLHMLRQELGSEAWFSDIITDIFEVSLTCTPANIGGYCKRLKDLAAQRCAQVAGYDLISSGNDPAEVLVAKLEKTAEEVRSIALEAEADPVNELFTELEDAVAGRRFSAPLPWEMLTRETRALMPGMITVLCGTPGATKSLAAVQIVRWLYEKGILAAYCALEHGTSFHLRRVAAQMLEMADLTDDDWCRRNPSLVEEAKHVLGKKLDPYRRAITALSDTSDCTPDQILGWIKNRARDARVLIVDPITIMETGDKPWATDKRFLRSAKAIIKAHGVSLVLVSHPRKLGQGVRITSMDDLAGGAAYSRFSQTILMLMAHDEKENNVERPWGVTEEAYNRTMVCFKATNGRGCEGHRYAFRFDPKTLTLNELGRVRKERVNQAQ